MSEPILTEERPAEILPAMPGGSPYSNSGVDRTLIWWMLSLTPEQRLEALTQFVAAIREMRRDWSAV